MSMDRTIPYRPDIDGLRAVAVGLVLIFHFELLPLGKGGFLGVDVFFVISGYLITSIVLKQLNNNSFQFSTFYLKRILRLAPALFAVLFMTAVAGAVIYLPSDFKELAKQLVATQLYFSNIYFWQNVNYFGLHADSVPMLHTWSLAVEEQFYLIFPAFLYLVHRFAKRYFWHIIGLAAIFSFMLNIVFVARKPELTFYLTPTRGWEFLVGSLALLLCLKLPKLHRGVYETISVLGVLAIFGSVLSYTDEVKFPGYYALYPSLGAGLIIMSGSHTRTFVSGLLGHPLVVYVGRLSYSLYLAHWPIHIFARYLLDDEYTLGWRLGMLALTFLIAVVLLHLVEDPIRNRKYRGKPALSYFGYFSGVGVSVVVFVAIIAADGLPQRFNEATVRMAAFSADQPAIMRECQFKDKPFYEAQDFCAIGAPGARATWLVYGDSHAWAAKEAFNLWLRHKGEAGLFMFRHACPPLKDIDIFGDKGACRKFNNNVLKYLAKTPEVNNVVLISTWVYGRGRSVTHDPNVQPERDQSYSLFKESFKNTLGFLDSAGKSVYVWEPVPGAKTHVPRALARSSDLDKTSREIAYTLKEHLSNHSYFYDILGESQSLTFKLFSPAYALCINRDYCEVQMQGKPVYFDNTHLTYSLHDFWVKVLTAQELHHPEIWRFTKSALPSKIPDLDAQTPDLDNKAFRE